MTQKSEITKERKLQKSEDMKNDFYQAHFLQLVFSVLWEASSWSRDGLRLKNPTDPSPFSETAELKFTIPINTTPIEMKFCEKLPFGLYVVDKYIILR